MSEEYLNAAEKARRARQAKESEDKAKRQSRRERRQDSNFVLLLFVAVILLIAAVTFALEIVGITQFSNVALAMAKITFYVSLGMIVVILVLGLICLRKQIPFLVVIGEGVFALALLVLGIVTLCGGRLGIKSFYVSAQYGVVYAEVKTEYSVWKIKDDKEDVYVLSTIEDKVVSKIEANAANGNEKMKTLTFGDGDITIGRSAFKSCARLTDVNFGKGDLKVYKHAFRDCVKLTNVTFEEGNISLEKYAFANCTGLENVTFNGNSKCYADAYTFSDCTGLKNFDIGAIEFTINNGDSSCGANLFGNSPNLAIHIDGGSFGIACGVINTIVCGNNSTVVLAEGVGHSEVVLKTIAFENGFDFTDTRLIRYKFGFFVDIDSYYAVAETIYLPASITKIPDNFFGDIDGDIKVYFAGTQEQWESIINNMGANGNANYTNGRVSVVCNSSYTD